MKLSTHQKKTLEGLLHQACILRDGEKCLRCGTTKRLCASHIYPKGQYRKMRYILDNTICFCYRCHIHWWHKNPLEAQEWYKGMISPAIQLRLWQMANTINKQPFDYNLIKLSLEQEIQKLKNE